MKIKKTDSGEPGKVVADADSVSSTVSSGRRRLLKGALASVPVILTVSSRPAWGMGNVCWSGIQSGNLSGHTHNDCGYGRSPGYYKKNVLPHGDGFGWPAGIDHGCTDIKRNGTISKDCQNLFNDPDAIGVSGTLFGDVFMSAPSGLAGMTCMQVLWQLPGSFAFHALATYFSSLIYSDYTFDPDDALDIINTILAMGEYTDDQGTIWSEADMKCLFASSYHPNDPQDGWPNC